MEDQMDHRTHQRLESAELTDSILSDAPVYGPSNEEVGTVSHIHRAAASAGIVVQVGGMPDLRPRQVLVSLADLDLMRDESGKVHGVTNWTREELINFPEHLD
jgi:hypothetical protein